jgi:hypothetical protein
MKFEQLVSAGQAGAYVQREEIKKSIYKKMRSGEPASYEKILVMIRQLTPFVDLTIERSAEKEIRMIEVGDE